MPAAVTHKETRIAVRRAVVSWSYGSMEQPSPSQASCLTQPFHHQTIRSFDRTPTG
jgi:hypothetical protein